MKESTVRDLMVPLSEYAAVAATDTIVEALRALEASRQALGKRGDPARAVLVKDARGKVTGMLEHIDFLKAIEPKYNLLGNLETLSQVGLSSEFMASMMEQMQFWQGDLQTLCHRAGRTQVRDVMRPITESLDEDAALIEAIHKLVMWQARRTLVTRRGNVVGVLRLADVFGVVSKLMQSDPMEG